MPNASGRRIQFSSCDACRRSRVACDASKFGHQRGKVRPTSSTSCSRCARRTRPCTFQWMDNLRRPSSNTTQETAEAESFVSRTRCEPDIFAPEPSSTTSLNPLDDFVSKLLTRRSDMIFHHGFDTSFGLLLGRHGCPFVNDPTSEACMPATRLFTKLDTDLDDYLNPASGGVSEVRRRRERDSQIDDSLRRAVQAFTARWLPLVLQRQNLPTSQAESVISQSWREARKDMLKVINRVSYRSALTLYLFAQTPIPTAISEEEEQDGINSVACIQTALLQIQKLRERQRCYFLDKSDASAKTDVFGNTSSRASLTHTYVDLESRAYWAAVMWDTSNSLTLNIRTSLTSGLNGACSEPAWRLVRTFLVGSFHPETEAWRTSGFELTDENASRVITAATVCKVYVWKNITSFKEALREGVDEESLLFVWRALMDAIDIFKISVHPLLSSLERRLHFLGQLNRQHWFDTQLQYYLGILVLANAVEEAGRTDLLPQIAEARQDAEQEGFNVLRFGIESSCTVSAPHEDSSGSTMDAQAGSATETIMVSLIATDSYPDHVIDFVLLMNKIFSRKRRQGEIKHEVHSYLSSTLLKALEQLPQSSKAAQAALKNLQQSIRKIN